MAVNLVDNVREALTGFPVKKVCCWLDSSVALHWIKGNGDYKQFVANRGENQQPPADLGSRVGQVSKTELWWRGPKSTTKLVTSTCCPV